MLRRHVVAVRRCGLFVRCLIALYVASLAAPLPAAAVEPSQIGGLVLELCTGDGARPVAIGTATRPLDDSRGGHRLDHDCHACSLGCVGKTPCGGSGIAVVARAPELAPTAILPSRPFRIATARAPLPPRGPPTLS